MKAVLAEALSAQGRGSQSRLADALGVRVQTVNKWVKGANAPDMERWPAIEEHLGLAPGTLADAAGVRQPDGPPGIPEPVRDAILELGAEIQRLRSELDELRSEVRGPRRSSDPAPPTPTPTGSAPRS